jgi:hypothetical protein
MRRRNPFSFRVLAVSIGIAVCIAASIFVTHQNGGSKQQTTNLSRPDVSSTKTSSPEVTAPSSPTSGQSSPSQPSSSGNNLNEQVKAFVSLYYSYKPGTTASDIKTAIKPYASGHFLRGTTILASNIAGDSPDGRSFEVTAPDGLNTETDGHWASGNVLLQVITLDLDNRVLQQDFPVIHMTWHNQNGRWVIYSIDT